MNNNKFISPFIVVGVIILTISCKKQLQVGNPNAATIQSNVTNEDGLTGLAQGNVYIGGFYNGDGWLGNSYFSLPWGYSELMADVVGADASNNQITTIGYPDYFISDNGTKTTNTSPQIGIIRQYNVYGGSGNNPLYNQWLNMYALNAGCNQILDIVDGIAFTGDATTKVNTVKAWCYWWKGYAYASIGTMYTAGLLIDGTYGSKSNNYLIKDSIIDRSNFYFNLASTTLSSGIASASDYAQVLGELIPSFCQVGKGGVLTTDMWIRNINTMLARNILLNKLAPFVNGNPDATISKSSISAMTDADWTAVLNYATNGIQADDFVFTGRSAASNFFFFSNGRNCRGFNNWSEFKFNF